MDPLLRGVKKTTSKLKSHANDFAPRERSNIKIDLFGKRNVVPNSDLSGLRFFVHCICIIRWHSHLNDMEIPETKRFIPKGFELGTTLS